MTDKNGFSLIELLVAVSIMGILMTMGFYGYSRLMVKSNIEADTRQILAAANRARQYSFTRKEILTLNLDGKNITVTEGGNAYGDFSLTTKTDFEIISEDGIIFRDGFSTAGVIRARVNAVRAEYDCILFEASRIRAGRYDGERCNVR